MDRNLIPSSTKKTDIHGDENSDDDKHINCTINGKGHRAVGFLTEWVAAYKFIKGVSSGKCLLPSLMLFCPHPFCFFLPLALGC